MRGSLTPLGVSALLMIGLAVAFGYGSLRLGFWDYGIPGSGLLPMMASVMLLLLAVILLWQARKREGEVVFHLSPGMALILMGGYAAILPSLGFAIPTVVMIFVWVKFIYRRPLWVALLVAGLLTLGGVALFSVFLDTPIEVWPNA
jgi:uncharacterized membrane protein